jgi:hypothetical protein
MRSPVPRPILGALLLVLVASLFAWPARAHTVPGGLTLHQLCRAADIIAIARVRPIPDPPKGAGPAFQQTTEAEIVEVLRGEVRKGEKVRFLPHRQVDEQYKPEEEILLFLQEGVPDKQIRWQAVDNVSEKLVLDTRSREPLLSATRGYAALGKGTRAGSDVQELRSLTLQMLASPEPRLGMFALRDLILAGPLPLVTAADVPALSALVDDATRPLGLRMGLLMELERRKLVEIGPRWVALLRAAPPAERVAVIRAAGSRWFSPPVTAEIITFLGGTDMDAAIAAARALGAEGNEAAVEPLGRAVKSEKAELRWAALGSLRRIASPAARARLAEAAASHPDPETRRVAQTELNTLPPLPPAPVTAVTTTAPGGAATGTHGKTWLVLGLGLVAALGLGLARLLRRGAADTDRTGK